MMTFQGKIRVMEAALQTERANLANQGRAAPAHAIDDFLAFAPPASLLRLYDILAKKEG